MEVTVKIEMDEQSMIDFMIHHVYTSKVGIITAILGVLNIGLTFAFLIRREYMQALLFGVFVILIFVVFPWFICKKVGDNFRDTEKQKEPVAYTFSEEGLLVEREGVKGLIPWAEFAKAIKKKRILILYRQNKKGIVFPLEQIAEQYTQVVNIIGENMPALNVRIPIVKER